jgi:hypothetical protein
MSSGFKRLSHTIYECKYHIVFCPKYRFRIIGIGEGREAFPYPDFEKRYSYTEMHDAISL